jgi:hypothetical protein
MYIELFGGQGVRAVLGFGQAISSMGGGRGSGKGYEWDREVEASTLRYTGA